MNETDYDKTNRLYGQIAPHVQEGKERKLPPVQLAHYPLFDTALAACLATLGIPFRTPAPFTDDVELDQHGNEKARRLRWWMGARSPDGEHKTEFLFGAWENRAAFEREHPLHPLVAMRAALDARGFWIRAKNGRTSLPAEPTVAAEQPYLTDSLHGASVLVASGYQPLAFSGRAFYLQRLKDGVHATQLLATAAQDTGATPPQWMANVLRNYSHLVGIAKRQSVIIRQPFEDQTLILTADSTAKTRDKFFRLLP